MESINEENACCTAIERRLTELRRTRHFAGLRSSVRIAVEAVLRDLAISPEGVAYVRATMDAPSRREGGGANNWSGFDPSRKMGLSMGFESATLEYPALTKCERDPLKIAYFNQAHGLKYVYVRENGRKGGHVARPDLLVVEAGVIAVVECKMEAELLRKSKSQPWLYQRLGDQWICPPGRAAAAALGMQHWVWTERTFTPVGIKNHLMLEDYLMPGSDEFAASDEPVLRALLGHLHSHPQTTIAQARAALGGQISIDQLYRAVAFGAVAIDFDHDSLADFERCMLYRDFDTLQAFRSCHSSRKIQSGWMAASQLTLHPGAELTWDGVHWKLLNLGNHQVDISAAGRFQSLPRDVFEGLVRDATIVQRTDQRAIATGALAEEAFAMMSKASTNDLRCATLRLGRIEPFLSPGRRKGRAPSRTERRYLADYRAAEAAYGNGFVGLLPGFSSCGNRRARLCEDVLTIVQERINEDYKNPKNVRAKRVHEKIEKECERKSLPAPSYAWFCRLIKRLDLYNLKKQREGARAAYDLQPRIEVDLDEHAIDLTATRPFERGMVDHTTLDLETRDSRTSKKNGRPWVTIMFDVCTRRVLGFHITFEPPSYRSVLAVMRDCVRRFGRLPAALLVDGGREFSGIWFEVTCAFLVTKVFRRPASRPRFGSHIERMFGTINSMFAHALCGNTQLRKNVRQMTDEVDPDVFSVWTLVALYGALEEFLFDIYDALPHRELMESPREAFGRLIADFGERPERRVAYDSNFLITTCPSTSKGTARVQPDGVKLNYVYFNHPLLARYLKKDVPVRYDCDDMSKAYAFIGGQWLQLKSKYRRQLRGRTEWEIKLYTTEFRARRSATEREAMSAKILVDFLERVAQTEEQLLRQRQINEQRLLAESQADSDPVGGALAPIEGANEEEEIGYTTGKCETQPAPDESTSPGAPTTNSTSPGTEDAAAVTSTPPVAPIKPSPTRKIALVACEEF